MLHTNAAIATFLRVSFSCRTVSSEGRCGCSSSQMKCVDELMHVWLTSFEPVKSCHKNNLVVALELLHSLFKLCASPSLRSACSHAERQNATEVMRRRLTMGASFQHGRHRQSDLSMTTILPWKSLKRNMLPANSTAPLQGRLHAAVTSPYTDSYRERDSLRGLLACRNSRHVRIDDRVASLFATKAQSQVYSEHTRQRTWMVLLDSSSVEDAMCTPKPKQRCQSACASDSCDARQDPALIASRSLCICPRSLQQLLPAQPRIAAPLALQLA